MALPITRAMRVQDILTLLPQAEPLLAEYGLHCVGCAGSSFETLEEGYKTHGFAEDRLDDLVTDLNALFERQPPRPKTIEVTDAAAKSLAALLESEGQADHILVVGLDDAGGFAMDVLPDVPDDHLFFGNAAVPTLRVAASPVTLARIGGATIDHRDGRFKLDLPEDAARTCACAEGGECGCAKEGKEPGNCGCH